MLPIYAVRNEVVLRPDQHGLSLIASLLACGAESLSFIAVVGRSKPVWSARIVDRKRNGDGANI